jgi:imidazolonepropionase-like amidohydrolase
VQGKNIRFIDRGGVNPQDPEAEVFDLEGYFALPGLIDCHVHLVAPTESGTHEPYWKLSTPPPLKLLCAARNAMETLKAGFTTVRNCGGVSYGLPEDVFLRQGADSGYPPGPRILACAGGITMTGGHGDRGYPAFMPASPGEGYGEVPCDDPSACRREVRRRVKMGADFIKAFTSGGVSTPGDGPQSADFTVEEIRAIVEEAHAREKRVAVHAYSLAGIRNSVIAGVDTVEHGCFLTPEVARVMADKGISLVTTLAVLKAILKRGKSYPNPEALKKAEAVVAAQSGALRIAREAGVNTAMGTDASVSIPNGKNALELIELVEAGLSPMEAVLMATRNAGIALGLEKEIGSIEQGKAADLIVLDKDPLRDISILTNRSSIRLVFKGGKPVCARNAAGEEVFAGEGLPPFLIRQMVGSES